MVIILYGNHSTTRFISLNIRQARRLLQLLPPRVNRNAPPAIGAEFLSALVGRADGFQRSGAKGGTNELRLIVAFLRGGQPTLGHCTILRAAPKDNTIDPLCGGARYHRFQIRLLKQATLILRPRLAREAAHGVVRGSAIPAP